MYEKQQDVAYITLIMIKQEYRNKNSSNKDYRGLVEEKT